MADEVIGPRTVALIADLTEDRDALRAEVESLQAQLADARNDVRDTYEILLAVRTDLSVARRQIELLTPPAEPPPRFIEAWADGILSADTRAKAEQRLRAMYIQIVRDRSKDMRAGLRATPSVAQASAAPLDET